ncbi:hypothetical protein BLNAU_8859 [Blattamonas nauphoetae]|uniref:Uncharacterized protein n=1 Tax=Blattamonas nauphoetae TaxID=2049346 RepID=A0ABQ9XXT1_9EUKA|nr:hypothetical protein BLNAU_8859 [Blattamonas nauphoetae]
MFEYSFGLQTQEVVELLTFKPFELQLLFEFVDEEQYQTHSISSSILFLNHSEEIVKLCGDDSTTISFIAQILTLSITNSSDIVAEYSSAGQITFSGVYARARQNKRTKTYKTDLLNNNSFLSILLTQRSLRPTLAPDFTTLLICVSASKLATDLDWNQVFRPHLLLSPPYKGSPPFTPLPSSSSALLHSSAMEIGEQSVWGGEVDLCVLTLSSLLTNTHVAVTQFNQESGEGSWCVVDQKATRDKEERKCTKWNRIRNVRLPNTLPTSHTTLLVTPTTMSSLHQISMLSGTRIRIRSGKSDERGEKERKKVVVKFMIDSLLSFIRKEMKTRTIKLVTLNPTRIVDNAQSELIVVFFPPLLDWLGRD